jgi:hypothetical protein
MVERDARQWARGTFGGCALGDERRTNRLVEYAAREAGSGAHSTSGACAGDGAAQEGAYRLIRNENVDPDAIAEGGFQATVEASRECRVLLGIEDSTTLGFDHSVAEELGDLGGKEGAKRRGFWVHSMLLVDGETERTVGLVHQQRWSRDPSARLGSKKASQKPRDAKESEKWRFASECAAERMGPLMSRVISVCDREADIYEYVAFKIGAGQRFVVRSCNDRLTETASTLWTEVTSTKKLGTMRIVVQQRGGKHPRAKREVDLALRAAEVTLKAPKYLGAGVPPIRVWGVHAVEENPPPGTEALEWLLLSSEPGDALESAQRVLRYYALRWRIEEFHKAWKSGCGVEERRMQSPDNLERIAVILAFLAVRTLQLNEDAARDPERPCDATLREDEWKCLWLATEKSMLPKKAPSALWARNAIAKLGGWFDTKRTGRVGSSTMAQGWLRLQDKLDGFRAAKALYDTKM